MVNNSVVSLYNKFGLIFKGSEDKATNGSENWSLLTTPLLTNVSSCQNHSEYLHKPYIARNHSLWQKFLSLTVWQYLHSFSHSCLQKQGKNLEKPTTKTDFSTKWHLQVIQDQSF